VVYKFFLGEISATQARADKLSFAQADQIRKRYQDITGLSVVEFERLRQLADEADRQSKSATSRMSQLVAAGDHGSNREELVRLRGDSQAAFARPIDTLREELGAGRFAAFDLKVRAYVAARLTATRYTIQQATGK
jgi:hypothetical protein